MKVNYVLMYGIPYVRYKEFETFEDISKFLVHKSYVNYSIFKKLEDKEEIEMIYRDNDIHYLENFVKEQDKEIERLNNIINELKWKPIEEYDKGNYDWVLVKYFDGDYECIPCVAEKRFGKWHSIDEKEIRFDVKYFMDMQQIDKLQELKGSNKE